VPVSQEPDSTPDAALLPSRDVPRGLRRPDDSPPAAHLGVSEADRVYALALTDRINRTARNLIVLVDEAHRLRVDRTLGYPSWEAYVEDNFKFTRQMAQYYIDAARVVREIEAVAGTSVELKERKARAEAGPGRGARPHADADR
jgi:hypothetical protein